MTDVVAVALISAGSSLLGASVGAITTYKVSMRNSETTIATAEAQKGVELAKVEAEMERLKQSNREEERRNRQSTYHQFIEAASTVYQHLGVSTSYSVILEIGTDYRRLMAGVALFAPKPVRNAALSINSTYQRIWPAIRAGEAEEPDAQVDELWRKATEPLKGEFGQGISDVIDLMHADVTRGIVSEPEEE